MGFSLQSFVERNTEAMSLNRRRTYDHLVQVLSQSVAPGRPEVYLRQAFAKIPQQKLMAGHLYMHLSEAYTTYPELCTRLPFKPGFGRRTWLLNNTATCRRSLASPRNAWPCGAPTRSPSRAPSVLEAIARERAPAGGRFPGPGTGESSPRHRFIYARLDARYTSAPPIWPLAQPSSQAPAPARHPVQSGSS
ncbi:hypothetical protein Efla_003194 [Eimeria flavescens]